MGRNPSSAAGARTEKLVVLLAPVEMDAVRLAAAGGASSVWARAALLRAANFEAPTPGDPIGEALAIEPRLSDVEIAARVGVGSSAVRRYRDAHGIGPAPRQSGGWRAVIAEAHGRGLTTAQIAVETGYKPRTVTQYLHTLGLSKRRLSAGRAREFAKNLESRKETP